MQAPASHLPEKHWLFTLHLAPDGSPQTPLQPVPAPELQQASSVR